MTKAKVNASKRSFLFKRLSVAVNYFMIVSMMLYTLVPVLQVSAEEMSGDAAVSTASEATVSAPSESSVSSETSAPAATESVASTDAPATVVTEVLVATEASAVETPATIEEPTAAETPADEAPAAIEESTTIEPLIEPLIIDEPIVIENLTDNSVSTPAVILEEPAAEIATPTEEAAATVEEIATTTEDVSVEPIEEKLVVEEPIIENTAKVLISEKVELGKTYVAPQNNAVTVTFTKLPENSGSLSIEEITLTPEQVAKLGALSSVAYDITSSMEDGTFECDVTLPIPAGETDVQVKNAEDVAGLSSAEVMPAADVEVDGDSANISSNHFTIFVATTSGKKTIVFDESPYYINADKDTIIDDIINTSGISANKIKFIFDKIGVASINVEKNIESYDNGKLRLMVNLPEGDYKVASEYCNSYSLGICWQWKTFSGSGLVYSLLKTSFNNSPYYLEADKQGEHNVSAQVSVPRYAHEVRFIIDGDRSHKVDGHFDDWSGDYAHWELKTKLAAGDHNITAEYKRCFDDACIWHPVSGSGIAYAIDEPTIEFVLPTETNNNFKVGVNPLTVKVDDQFNQFKQVKFKIKGKTGAPLTFLVERKYCDLSLSGNYLLCDVNKSNAWVSLADGRYSAEAQSETQADNNSDKINSIYFFIDSIAPELSDFTIDTEVYDSKVPVYSKSIAVSAMATDNNGVKNIYFSLTEGSCDSVDKIVLEATSSNLIDGKYRTSFNTAELNGGYCLNAQVEDEAGNLSEKEKIQVKIDNVAPKVALTNLTDGTIFSSTVGSTIDIKGSVIDANPHHYWMVIMDGAGNTVAGPGTVNDNTSFTDKLLLSWNISAVLSGTYKVKLEARDAADNKDATSVTVKTIIIDNTVPTIPNMLGFIDRVHNYTVPCGGATNANNITVDWSDATDANGIAGYDYQINYPQLNGARGVWNQIVVPSEYTGSLNEGIHYVKVRAKDKAGNVSAWSQECAISLDTKAPTATYKHYIDGVEFGGKIAYVNDINKLSFTGEYRDVEPSSGLLKDSYVIFDAQRDGSFAFMNNGAKAYCGWRQKPNLVTGLAGTSSSLTELESFANCTKNLPDGEYYMSHQVYDNAIRKDIPSITQFRDVLGLHFIIDQTAPTVPTGGQPRGKTLNINDFDFTWSTSTDQFPVTYEFQSTLNSAQENGVLTTNLWKSGVLPSNMIHSSGAGDGAWYWQVRAIDSNGNKSAWSEIWNVTLKKGADLAAPVLLGATSTAPTTVIVGFNEDLNGERLNVGDFRITCDNEKRERRSSSNDYDGSIGIEDLDEENGLVTLFLSQSLPNETKCHLTINPEVPMSIMDLSENEIYETETIDIVDGIKPEITLEGKSPVTITVGEAYEDAGATAYDNMDGDITEAILVNNPLATSTSEVGNYAVTYNVTDSSGNIAEQVIRIVNVVAKEEKKPQALMSLGGGSFTPECRDVMYTCVNKVRELVNPAIINYCALTPAQQAKLAAPCEENSGAQQVLGVQKYSIGTLLKSKTTRKIYIVTAENILKHVISLKDLWNYRNKPIISVDESVIASYSQVFGSKKYTDGTLVRHKGDKKIYVIINGEQVHLKTLKDLLKYFGHPILEIE